MNLFQKAKTWLTEKVEAAAGETVTYTRGAESQTLTAVVGQTVFAQQVEGAARVLFGDRDYLIDVAVFPYATPQIGDRITHSIDGTNVVFEVQRLETGEPSWRYSDPDRTVWRIHVKRVS